MPCESTSRGSQHLHSHLLKKQEAMPCESTFRGSQPTLASYCTLLMTLSSRTDLDDDVVDGDVTSFSALDLVEIKN